MKIKFLINRFKDAPPSGFEEIEISTNCEDFLDGREDFEDYIKDSLVKYYGRDGLVMSPEEVEEMGNDYLGDKGKS